eukprot:NODE_2454_length_1418_cov_248.730502_g2334_i0.p1 GENE.NODE_2454_length_1418_cov_248.730502_g2334_i0~~NODE_2454_length_1418_cov_248.730502_g2334_i0.p1  ORF type:complete len:337 (-),score=55.23 NODE_2454_length_1418_cov_248.730502_g2334_i0:407-1354(-)
MALTPAEEEGPKVKVCSGHSRPVAHIAYSNIVDDSFWFVSSCLDGKPHLRNGETGDWVGTFEGHKGAVWMSCFNKAATHITTASGDYSVKIWNALEGTDLQTWHQPHCVKSVDWQESGGASRLVTGAMDKVIRLYDVNSPATEPVAIEGHSGIVKTAVFHGDNQETIFSASGDNTIKRWDLRSLQASHNVEIKDLRGLEYHKGQDLLVVSSKFAVTFLSPNDLSVVRQFTQTEEVECVSLAPDGSHFALGSKLKVKEFDKEGNELQTHRGHHGPIFTIQYAPLSDQYASGSEDGMVRIWPTSRFIPAAPAKEPAA